ncbi:MAG: hypothetical protein H7333_06495 [Bdellovibrionales bacterium]|nr:hypothetical protein [Oligoflexia bacterium]
MPLFINIVCLTLFSFWFTPIVQATEPLADLKTSFSARTYPIGAQFAASPGIALPIWGDTSTWKYGYARLGLNLASSLVVNRAGVEIQVNPISILGLSAGYDTGVRNITPKYLDCSLYECNHRLDRKYLKMLLLGASHGVILSVMGRYEELRAYGSRKPFFDEMTLLVGSSTGENVLTWNPALLYVLNENWKLGATSLYSHALDTGDYSHLYGPVGSYTVSPQFNILGGGGLNRSPVVHSGWAAFFVLQYTVEPSLSIVDLPLRKKSYLGIF